MKLALSILLLIGVASAPASRTATVIAGPPIATIGPLVNGSRVISYSGDPGNYVWILEIACSPQGPFEYCPEAHYLHGTLTDFTPRPNHFYRLHGVTNDGRYNYF